jgi:N-acetylglucosamine-6-phosphate deacetylase
MMFLQPENEMMIRGEIVTGKPGQPSFYAEIRIFGGRIAAVTEVSGTSSMSDDLIVPGFIDIHVHGGAGADFMEGDIEKVSDICRHHLHHGTTSMLATTKTAAKVHIDGALRAVHDFQTKH